MHIKNNFTIINHIRFQKTTQQQNLLSNFAAY